MSTLGVVVVTFNCRMGNLGFLARPDLDLESPTRLSSGNYGLEDQIQALQWVSDNIAAFRGDPSCMTVFGESAGSHSVSLLLASPLTRGLFHPAIIESSAWWDSEHGSLTSYVDARAMGVPWG
ncbi:Carboxylesterase family-domain-containing protein, partial [Mycena galopus ATCC 62051]